MDRVMGSAYPMSRRESVALKAELLGVPGVAELRDTVLERHMAEKKVKDAMPRMERPTRPPPWVSETWGDPAAGDNLPYVEYRTAVGNVPIRVSAG